MKKSQFLEYILDLLSPFGNITYRAMFGGYGLYKSKIIFAVIIKDELYFKAPTKESEGFYIKSESEPFTYQGKKGLVKMNYWKVLPEALDDPALLEEWLKMALINTH